MQGLMPVTGKFTAHIPNIPENIYLRSVLRDILKSLANTNIYFF
jgi:hypothetical protein